MRIWIAIGLLVLAGGLTPPRSDANEVDFTNVFSEETRVSDADLLKLGVRIKVIDAIDKNTAAFWYGSGVLVPGGVLTAWHVVETKGRPGIRLEADGEIAYGTSIRSDKGADIAFVAVAWKKPHGVAQLAAAAPEKGRVVTSIGRLADGEIQSQSHKVEGYSRWDQHRELRVSPSFNPGRSGGGVFDSTGKLVAIVTSMELGSQGQGIATGVETIRALLEKPAAATESKGKLQITLHVKPNCRPGDAVCARCVRQAELLGVGDARVAVTVSTDSPPLPVTGRLRLRPGGFQYPVIVWTAGDKWYYIAGPGIYSLDQIVQAMTEAK